MIKIETITGQPFQDGIDIICKIVEKRARLELFESDVLEKFNSIYRRFASRFILYNQFISKKEQYAEIVKQFLWKMQSVH